MAPLHHNCLQDAGNFQVGQAIRLCPNKSNCKMKISSFSTIENHEKAFETRISSLQDVFADSDPYRAVESLRKEINSINDACFTYPTKDYSILTNKGDASVDEACVYAMRDAIQWWRHWHGSLENHRWKHLYIALSTIPEDVAIPPQHLVDGKFCFLGNSLTDVLDGLHQEGASPDNIAFMEMCLLRQYLVQYISNQGPEFNSELHKNPALTRNWRNITGNISGSTTALLLAAKTAGVDGIAGDTIRMTPIVDSLSMVSTKTPAIPMEDTLTSQENRERKSYGLHVMYLRYMELLDLQPSAPLISRSVSSGLQFIPNMDGAFERMKYARIPVPRSLRDTIDIYIGR